MKGLVLMAAALSLLLSACGHPDAFEPRTADSPAPSEPVQPVWVYLGVEDYGLLDASQRNAFRYRFYHDGAERSFSVTSDADFTLQNLLVEGRAYRLTLDGDVVTGAALVKGVTGTAEAVDTHSAVIAGTTFSFETSACADVRPGGAVLSDGLPEPGETVTAVYDASSGTLLFRPAAERAAPPVSGTPGERTVLNFLKTAMMPVGTTLYVFGGGWNWQDTGASRAAASIGLSEEWETFFRTQDESYTYKSDDPARSYYPFGGWNEYGFAGLDCSGYVGWTLYNTIYDHDGEEGLVFFADRAAQTLADRGWGGIASGPVQPGDVVSLSGHVWIAVGTCADGSVVLAHSTPSMSKTGAPGGGVQLSAIGADTGCEAYELAQAYMTQYFPAWSERYEPVLRQPSDYLAGKIFRWDDRGLSDPDGVRGMDAAQVLRLVFDAAPIGD